AISMPLDRHGRGTTDGGSRHGHACLNDGLLVIASDSAGVRVQAAAADRAGTAGDYPSKTRLDGRGVAELLEGSGRALVRPPRCYGGRRGRYGDAGQGLLDRHVHGLGAALAKRVGDSHLERVAAGPGEGCRDTVAARGAIVAAEGNPRGPAHE